MKPFTFLFLISFSFLNCALGQSNNADAGADYVGNYFAKIDSLSRMVIRKENNGFTMEFVGQGRVSISSMGGDRFSVNRVRPEAIIEFKRDSTGKVTKFKWIQPLPKYVFTRIRPLSVDSSANQAKGIFSNYVGNYQLNVNKLKILQVRVENNHLTIQGSHEGKLVLTHVAGNRFILVDGELKLMYDFVPGKNGEIATIHYTRTGSLDCIKTNESFGTPDVVYGFNRPNGFTRADSLRGKLTPLRTCYDVLFYDLNVTVDPSTQSVSGNNKIRFKAMNAFDKMQVDLFANMQIEKILYHNTPLSFTREFNAVFIQFPEKVDEGVVDEINVLYSGKPQIPDGAILAGGIFWLQDKDGQHWIETVTQGSGASLWWPCKDHLSDKPDSMKISVTVPHGLTDISNGRLLRKTELPGNLTRFDWYVSYPITNYCVVMNIGNYIHFSDQYVSGSDTLSLNFYCLQRDERIAKKIFRHAKPILSVFEKDFGKYPFWRDGFTVMQSVYPMEHQSAVSIGSIFNPFNSNTYDSLDLIRTMWHECAHEWWGNNVTIKDMADLWIHEAFATYAEVLAYEKLEGNAAMQKYLKEQTPGNKEAIVGKYDVNDFHLGDMYPKGALLLHTLRNVIDNDSLWFDLLRGIQTHFAFQTITTRDLVNYINEKTQTDYTYFFEQYLTKASIPKLKLLFKKENNVTHVKYKWDAEVDKFNMPIKVTTSKNVYAFIYPTKDWNDLELKDMKPKDFKVDTEKFYVGVKSE
jgi:hypothetical protein